MLRRWNLKGHETWARPAIAGAAAADPESALKIIKYTLNIIPQHGKTLFGRASNSMRASVICQMNCVAQICQTMPGWDGVQDNRHFPSRLKFEDAVCSLLLHIFPLLSSSSSSSFTIIIFFILPVPRIFFFFKMHAKHCTFFTMCFHKDVMMSKILSMIIPLYDIYSNIF